MHMHTASDAIGAVMNAIEIYHQQSCIRFVERTNQDNYVRIFRDNG